MGDVEEAAVVAMDERKLGTWSVQKMADTNQVGRGKRKCVHSICRVKRSTATVPEYSCRGEIVGIRYGKVESGSLHYKHPNEVAANIEE